MVLQPSLDSYAVSLYELVADITVIAKPSTPMETVSSTAKFKGECNCAKALKLSHQSTSPGSVAGMGWFYELNSRGFCSALTCQPSIQNEP